MKKEDDNKKNRPILDRLRRLIEPEGMEEVAESPGNSTEEGLFAEEKSEDDSERESDNSNSSYDSSGSDMEDSDSSGDSDTCDKSDSSDNSDSPEDSDRAEIERLRQELIEVRARIEEARLEGIKEGRNARIEELLKTEPGDGLPALGPSPTPRDRVDSIFSLAAGAR